MKRGDLILEFLHRETDLGFSVAHGWDISIVETLLPPGIKFPLIFKELYNSYGFESFCSSPICFFGNNDGNASEIYKYYENNIDNVVACCELGYLPFANVESDLLDLVCFDLENKENHKGEYTLAIIDYEKFSHSKTIVLKDFYCKSLYQFMRDKIE